MSEPQDGTRVRCKETGRVGTILVYGDESILIDFRGVIPRQYISSCDGILQGDHRLAPERLLEKFDIIEAGYPDDPKKRLIK